QYSDARRAQIVSVGRVKVELTREDRTARKRRQKLRQEEDQNRIGEDGPESAVLRLSFCARCARASTHQVGSRFPNQLETRDDGQQAEDGMGDEGGPYVP